MNNKQKRVMSMFFYQALADYPSDAELDAGSSATNYNYGHASATLELLRCLAEAENMHIDDILVEQIANDRAADIEAFLGYPLTEDVKKNLDSCIKEKFLFGLPQEVTLLLGMAPELKEKQSAFVEARGQLACSIADRYISIQDISISGMYSAYEYFIMDMDYKVVDSGLYNALPNTSIMEALQKIIIDLQTRPDYSEAAGKIKPSDEPTLLSYEAFLYQVRNAPQTREEEQNEEMDR